jgi:hypothetical protein
VRWQLARLTPVLFEGVNEPALDVIVTSKVSKQQLATVDAFVRETLGERFKRISVGGAESAAGRR